VKHSENKDLRVAQNKKKQAWYHQKKNSIIVIVIIPSNWYLKAPRKKRRMNEWIECMACLAS
jgi:hypothetical protein